MPEGIAEATTSDAIDTFVKCVTQEFPHGIRLTAVNPTVIAEAWWVYGEMMPS
ncbi:hypothetical protein [Pandoraea sputorum]|uniref:hypothetical protein n=1 Tax=Pandoraea sputorum TaxID=93222 RepID=UPI001CD7F3C8|nr:hypothetical protein [Pandoraea sputorum]